MKTSVSILKQAFSGMSLISLGCLALLVALGVATINSDSVAAEWEESFATYSPEPRLNRLIHAIASDDVARVGRVLATRPPELSRTDSDGLLAMSRATVMPSHSAPAMVRLLIDHGADVNLADENGITPLITAVARDHEELVRLLLAGGADPNRRFNGNRPTLHYVAGSNCGMAIATLLLEAGADPNARDMEGKKASASECRQEHAGLTQLLIAAERAAETPVSMSTRGAGSLAPHGQ